jgi:hypothetical protein
MGGAGQRRLYSSVLAQFRNGASSRRGRSVIPCDGSCGHFRLAAKGRMSPTQGGFTPPIPAALGPLALLSRLQDIAGELQVVEIFEQDHAALCVGVRQHQFYILLSGRVGCPRNIKSRVKPAVQLCIDSRSL